MKRSFLFLYPAGLRSFSYRSAADDISVYLSLIKHCLSGHFML